VRNGSAFPLSLRITLGCAPYLRIIKSLAGVRDVKGKSWLDFKDPVAQPDSKWQVYGKAEPFLTTGGSAVPNNDGLVAALLRRATFVFSVTLWWLV